MQEEVEARQQAEAEAARLAEEQRIRVGGLFFALEAFPAAELCLMFLCLAVSSKAACVASPSMCCIA